MAMPVSLRKRKRNGSSSVWDGNGGKTTITDTNQKRRQLTYPSKTVPFQFPFRFHS